MAAEAIAQYLEDKTPIPDQLRRMIREIPEFAIEAATSTRGLAQHVLWTNAGNIKCLFHRLKRGVKDLRDGCVDTQMHHMIHGVPAGEGQESLLRGTVMCGCSLESALWDLFIWKTMTVSSDNPAVIPKTEYLNTNMLTPRHRAFFIQAYSAGTTLTLDDVYTGQSGQVFGTEQYLYRLQMLKVHRELEAANKNGAVLGLAPMTVTPVGLPAAGAKAQEDEMMKYVNA
ncbi:hypothetical protein DFH06DRAFT_1012547 [Mycena polygramma]|nr:hypothetical protein DFH06DRAFT_1012547 [Mycena polygramma]